VVVEHPERRPELLGESIFKKYVSVEGDEGHRF
jgi:hypothetical protein